MKILMVTTFYPPHNFGGDGVFVYRLTNMLARQGHDVHVVYNVDAYNLLGDQPLPADAPTNNHPNVTTHPLSSGVLAAVDTLAVHQLGMPALKDNRLRELIEDSSFDVVHFHNVSLMGAPKIFTYGSAVKLCTMHEEWLVCPMHILWRYDREPCTERTCITCTLHGRRPIQWWRYNGSLDRTLAHVDAFITPSRFTRDIVHRNKFTQPIHVIPYFFPNIEVQPDTSGDMRFLERPDPARPYFLFVGRLEKIKGAQVLIDVFRRYPHADLVIAGRGTYEPELRKMADGMNNVFFTGFLQHDQLRTLYRRTVASIIPSICYETFGWVTLESYTNRTPVIVHDLGALPEVVHEGGGGFTYQHEAELIDAMEQLRCDPALRDQLGEQGFASYQAHFTEARHLEMYFGLIEQIQRKETQR